MSRERGPCCRIEAVATIDERGQMVLPKDVRERAKLLPGTKLAVVLCEQGGELCCIALVPTDRLENAVTGLLGPALGGS